MKILIINQHVSDMLGGSEMQCDLIAKGLVQKGHDVVYGAVKPKKDNYTGFDYKIIPLNIENKNELLGVLEKEKPDVVYWRFNKHFLKKAVMGCKQEKTPFVFGVSHINDTKRFVFKGSGQKGLKFYKMLLKQIIISAYNYQAFKYVSAVTVNNGDHLNKIPVPKQKVIWNAVVKETEEFDWKKDFCLWVANIKDAKRPEVFIRVAKKLSFDFPEVEFLMIGAIQQKKYYDVIKQAEKEIPNFHYLGSQKPEVVNGALKKAKCLVHTCAPEGFPNNFIQAWTQGCPTVSLDFDPDELIKKENLGFVSGGEDRMKDQVKRLLQDESLRKEIGERAKKFAKANFAEERMINELEEFLEKVVKEKENESR